MPSHSMTQIAVAMRKIKTKSSVFGTEDVRVRCDGPVFGRQLNVW